MALGVGVPLILTCLCLVGTAAVVLSHLVIRSKKKGNCVGNLFSGYTYA